MHIVMCMNNRKHNKIHDAALYIYTVTHIHAHVHIFTHDIALDA